MSRNLERLRLLTERLEVEPHSEKIIADILGTCVPGKALINKKDRFLYYNKYFRETIGYTDEELKSMTLSSVVSHPGHNQKVIDWFTNPRILYLRKVQVVHKIDGLIDVAVGIVPQNGIAAVGLVRL
jgi:PAS domain-containing protein